MNDSSTDIATTSLGCQRELFRLPPDICYLNTAFMSPLLKSAWEATQAGIELRSEPWKLTADDFFEPAERVRRLFAEITHGDADGVFLAPSISYVMAIAAANLPCEPGSNIVVVIEQFPSNVYPWRKVAERKNAEIRTVKFTTDKWTDSILAAIDERTAIITIPHVHWTTGVEFDLTRISSRARDVGAALIVDATQSLGALPFDIRAIQPDVLAATGYKSMLGPYGLTYCHLAPQWRNGVPLEEGWLNRTNARTFSMLTEYCDDYMPGARRYDMGERANSLLLPMAIAALEQIAAWGVDRIEQYTRPLIRAIVDHAESIKGVKSIKGRASKGSGLNGTVVVVSSVRPCCYCD